MIKSIKYYTTFFLAVAPFPLAATPHDNTRRIHNHWLLKDYDSVLSEVQSIQKTSKLISTDIATHQVMALICLGRESEALDQLRKLIDAHPEVLQNRHLLEMLSWGVIQKSQGSNLLQVNVYALLGSSLTHDARAIPFLLSSLRSSNTLIRSIAVKLSCSFADEPLKKQLLAMLESEKDWYVRIEIIKSCGLLKLQEAMAKLVDIVSDTKSTLEETSVALLSLVEICDHLHPSEIHRMTSSSSSGLRALACDLILEYEMQSETKTLLTLLADSSPMVRLRSLNALATLQVKITDGKPINDRIETLITDTSAEVAITAAWYLASLDDERGVRALLQWLKHSEHDLQRLAASAIAALGSKGTTHCFTYLDADIDKYAQVNLAMGLLMQKEHVQQAVAKMFSLLEDKDAKWIMWENSPCSAFKGLAPSRVRHIESMPNYPAFIDRQVRLELFSWLAALGESAAKKLIRDCLKERAYATTTLAMISLLDVGDEGSFELITELLTDADPDICVEAALLLAFNGGNEAAIDKLKQLYPNLDREKKLFVLEALGSVGGGGAIPFLLQALQDSFQLIRVVAASSLIRCLYL